MIVRRSTFGVLATALVAAVVLGGCAGTPSDYDPGQFLKLGWYRFFEPSKIVAKPVGEPVYKIVDTLSATDVYNERLPNSRLPAQDDLIYDDSDYVIGPTDQITIAVMDLYVQGQESVFGREVSPIGNIDLPLLDDRMRVDGMTALELASKIEDAYSPEIIRDPKVTVTVTARRQSQFTIVGAAQQGKYFLERPDTRLIQALAVSGGIPQMTGVRYIYIIRQKRPKAKSQLKPKDDQGAPATDTAGSDKAEPAAPAKTQPTTDQARRPRTALEADLQKTTEPATDKGITTEPPSGSDGGDGFDKLEVPLKSPDTDGAQGMFQELDELGPPAELRRLSVTEASGQYGPQSEQVPHKWARRNGRWVKVPLYPKSQPQAQPQAGKKAVAPATVQPKPSATVQDPPPATTPQPATVTVQPVDPAPVKRPDALPASTTMPRTILGRALGRQAAEALPVAPKNPPAPGVQPTFSKRDPLGWDQATGADQIEIIAINLEELQSITPRMNVIVRDNDTIYIPSPSAGEFYMFGEVERPGVYALTGNGTTVKQAMAAGGNFTGIAWPANSYLIRRIGRNEEQVIPINMERIFQGKDPDFYLRNNDMVAVGTHVVVPFLQALRGIVPSLSMGFTYSKSFNAVDAVTEGTRFKKY